MTVGLTNEGLLEYLRQKNFDVQFQPETKQISAHVVVGRESYPFFVKLDTDSGILQLLVFIPYALQPNTAPDIARLLHYCNKEIDLPGFGIDELVGAIYYRCVLVGTKGEIAEEVLDKALRAIPRLCETFFPIIIMSMSGKMRFDTVLQKAKKEQNKR